jgi:hypothetical protein
MKFIRLIGLLVFMGCASRGWSQDAGHFIYLQSDTKQPFFVKLSPTADPLNSSGSGYLILPKVSQGPFSFWVGFPDNATPVQHFVCTIDADKGFLLKHFPDKGWALYDLQELTLTYAAKTDSTAPPPAPAPPDTTGKGQPQSAVVTAPVDTPRVAAAQSPSNPVVDTPVPPKPTDAFGDALVAVTRDTTLRDVKKIVRKTPPPVQPAPIPSGSPADIVLVSRQVTDTAVQLVYADRQASGAIDTVQVLMPQAAPPAVTPAGGSATPDTSVTRSEAPAQTISIDSPVAVKTAPVDTPVVTPVDTTHAFNPVSLTKAGKTKDTSNFVVPVFKQGQGADSSRGNLAAGFGNQPTTTQPATAQTATTQPATTTATPAAGDSGKGIQLANSNCSRVAGDEDYQRLRKKMASESDVDRMIELARKAFKKTCFTSDQIRSLSFLFLQEDGRYKFIEEAYPFASDSWNFTGLQSLFSSVYYVNRFKALVQH